MCCLICLTSLQAISEYNHLFQVLSESKLLGWHKTYLKIWTVRFTPPGGWGWCNLIQNLVKVLLMLCIEMSPSRLVSVFLLITDLWSDLQLQPFWKSGHKMPSFFVYITKLTMGYISSVGVDPVEINTSDTFLLSTTPIRIFWGFSLISLENVVY